MTPWRRRQVRPKTELSLLAVADRSRLLLHPVFELFVEGADTVDLKAAERLPATPG